MRVAWRLTYRSEDFIGINLNSGYNVSNGLLNYFMDKVLNMIELFLGKGVQGG